MSELKPVNQGMGPDVAALAVALRDLFQGLGVSTRRYAARRAYDSSTVSRYLSGSHMPPWEFVLNLLHDVAEERGTVPTEQTIAMLRDLHNAALSGSKSPAHKVQLLERKLAEADQEARRAAARERWLEDALQDREHRVRDLQTRFHELQASASASASSEPLGDAAAGERADEQARLREEVRELREELARVRERHQRAEERCEQLERQLADAEGGSTEASEDALLPEVVHRATETTRVPEDTGPAGSAGTAEAEVHNRFMAAPGSAPVNSVYQIGHVHGSVTVNADDWQVDEEIVAAVSVRVCELDGHLGNGLLLDARTVITSARLPADPLFSGVHVVVAGRLVEVAAVVETLALPELDPLWLRYPAPLVVLRLAEPVPVPEQPLTFDWRPRPGRQLLVSAHAATGPYSCVLDVRGRTGDWLRVAGEVVRGLIGAPAFSSTGGLAGLVLAEGGQSGLLLPVAALRALTSVRLEDPTTQLDDDPAGSRPGPAGPTSA
ncbi:hypothetical protein OYE22_14885 [Streptomyces sp. 71268]|uniref:hypothetical protein n=1 Tax=Streptomyces sp. 71268 TaxID=3002640 RepID=UPI0023F75C45|nr:hypothetical protein [Streptomyces sp. 71268]WEV26338.1 hypothetical protein OYE22_14885 [Streptomyces sp. 71268]